MIDPEAHTEPKTYQGHGRPGSGEADTGCFGTGEADETDGSNDEARALRDENRALQTRVSELEAELAKSRQASGPAGQLLAAMNHDLRAPLHVIIGLAGILCDPHYKQSEQERVKSLHDIKFAGDHLLGIVNDILDLSRIEAGRLRLVPDLLHVGGVLERAVEFMSTRAHEKGILICPEVRPPGIAVYADERRLRQILYNLLDNAIKYSPPHSRIDVTAAPEGEMSRICITDRGPGIAPEQQERIFELYARLEQIEETVGGTGLGLPLARQLVEMQGGTLTLDSSEGKGSTFTVMLPAAAPLR